MSSDNSEATALRLAPFRNELQKCKRVGNNIFVFFKLFQNSIYKHIYILQLHCSLIFFCFVCGTDLDKKEERILNKCSVYVNVDVQLFWKLLLVVWKATVLELSWM